MNKIHIISILAIVALVLSSCQKDKVNEGTISDNCISEIVDTELISDNERLINACATQESLFCITASYINQIEIIDFDWDLNVQTETILASDDFEYGLNDNFEYYTGEKYYYIDNSQYNSQHKGIYLISSDNKKMTGYIELNEDKAVDLYVSENDKLYILCYEYSIKELKYRIDIYEEGEKSDSIDMESVGANINNCEVLKVCADKSGTVFVLYQSNEDIRILAVNADKEIEYDKALQGVYGGNYDISCSPNGELYVFWNNEGKTFINKMNFSGEILDMGEVNITGEVIKSYDKRYNCYIRDESGIYGVILDEGEVVNLGNIDCELKCDSGIGHVSAIKKSTICQNCITEYDLEELSEQNILGVEEKTIIDCSYNTEGKLCYIENDNADNLKLVVSDKNKIIKDTNFKIADNEVLVDVYIDKYDYVYLLLDDYFKCETIVRKYNNNLEYIEDYIIEDSKFSNKVVVCNESIYVEHFSIENDMMKFEYVSGGIKDFFCEYELSDLYFQRDDSVLFRTKEGRLFRCVDNSEIYELSSASESLRAFNKSVNNLIYISDDYLLIISDNAVYKLFTFEANPEKTLKIAVDLNMTSVDGIIEQYKLMNSDICIKILDYSDYTNNEINFDIASGNIPDMIISDGNIDFSIFECKNVLMDLSGYLSEYDSNIFFSNIFNACSQRENEVTQIVPSFKVITAIGRKSELGEKMGWSYLDFVNFKKSNSERNLFYYIDVPELYTTDLFTQIQFSEFIDVNEKKCEIDDTYECYLDILKELYSSDTKKDDNDYYEDADKFKIQCDYERRFLEHSCMLDVVQLGRIRDIYNYRYGYIGEPIVFKGLPSLESNGSYIVPNLKVSILKNCKVPNEAWKLIELFLDEKNQNPIADYETGFPVLKSSFERMFDNYKYNSIYIGEEMVEINPNDNELREQIYEWVNSLSVMSNESNSINGIVQKEIQSFFKTKQNSKVTIENIKKKVNIFLQETG